MLKKKINKNMPINIGKLMGISGSFMYFINPSWTNSIVTKREKNSISNRNPQFL